MNVWLSSQAVARITELLAVVAARRVRKCVHAAQGSYGEQT